MSVTKTNKNIINDIFVQSNKKTKEDKGDTVDYKCIVSRKVSKDLLC